MFPPLPPSWDGFHPLVIHFPIGLLLIVPLFLAISLLPTRWSRCSALAALVLMVAGTVSAFVAVSTGFAAGEMAERTPEITAVIERHMSLAETTRMVFSALTVVYALLLAVPLAMRREFPHKVFAAAQAVFLIVYMAGALVLVNTGHQGGRLVHEFGVKAMMVSPTDGAK